ncbi:MAG: EF-hand domain-containing protein [Pseudoxanthomonas suwonensis]|nr:EF-hand domain-containing protein [Pseudoxanthomonas suwonensis]
MQRFRPDMLALAIAGTVLAAATVAAPQARDPASRAERQQAMWQQIDSNNDGTISREEAAARPGLARRFDQLDADGDGRLSRTEMAAARTAGPRSGRGDMPRKGTGQHRGMMMQRHRALDTDKDGRISRAEAAADERLTARFDQLDANRDGHLDRADWQARASQQREAFFTRADTDNDGRLSRAEFDAAHNARHARMQQQRAERAAARADRQQQTPAPQRNARPQPTLEQRQQRMAQMFSRLDADNDGHVSRAEFDAAAANRMGRRQGAGGPGARGN